MVEHFTDSHRLPVEICIVNTDRPMIRVRLREAMRTHEERTGRRTTYGSLSEETGISVATLQSLGARPGYNATLATIERICRALGCTPGELLELDDGGEAGRTACR